MGKTKIKTIDESVQDPQPKASQPVAENVGVDLVSTRNSKKEKTSKRALRLASLAQGKPKQRGKKYQEARGKVEVSKRYPVAEAVKLTQEVSYSKFPGTIEAHINTATKNIRGLVSLPFLAGKKLTILAFGQDADKSGADIVGTEETIKDIEAGKINFDVVVTTPAWMPKLAKAAKILGPRGLMPNPKSGTITEKLAKAVSDLQAGKVEYKTEKDGQVIHLPVGKVNQNPEEVAANIKTLVGTIGKTKIKKVTLSPTMGPGVRIDLGSI